LIITYSFGKRQDIFLVMVKKGTDPLIG
jgi:hypothetical protein